MRLLPRREYLSLLLASTAGCSLFEGAGVPDDPGDAEGGAGPSRTQVRTTSVPDEESPSGSPVTDGAVARLLDGNLVVVSNDATAALVDPRGTSTPVQDGIDLAADSGGGRVFLPPRVVREDGPIRPRSETGVYGFGMNVSVVDITREGVDGVRFDRSPAVHRFELDGFALRGPGLDADTGAAIHHVRGSTTADAADFHVGRLYFRRWANAVYRVDEGVGPYQCRHDYLRADDCDAGQHRGLVEWNSSYGPANWFGTLVAYPVADRSGANTTILHQRGGELAVDELTVGGSAGTIVNQRDGRLRAGRIHYEPTDQRTTPRAVVSLAEAGATSVGAVVPDSGVVDAVYELGPNCGGKTFAFDGNTRARILRAPVVVSGVPNVTRRNWYYGRRSDVLVTHGGPTTGAVRVMDDAGTGVA